MTARAAKVANEKPTIPFLVSLLKERFVVREDTFCILSERFKKPQRAKVDNLDALLTAHVAGSAAPKAKVSVQFSKKTIVAQGHFRVGAYQLDLQSKCRWFCIDFDAGTGHACCLEDPLAAAMKTIENLTSYGLEAHLEQSGGGSGWHVWVFFSEPVAASVARNLGMRSVPKDARLTKEHSIYGKFAVPEKGAGIEVFPKQTQIDADGFGNQVWLPFWSEAKGNGNLFHMYDQLDSQGKAKPLAFWPSYLEAADALGADLALAEIQSLEHEHKPRQEKRVAAEDWDRWRDEAREKLNIDKIYGKWLTGRRSGSSRGWLECRDPWSPTGDQTISAGVSDGTGKAVRGTFHSFISGETFTLFNFMIKIGMARDFADACKLVSELSGVELPDPVQTALAEGHNLESPGDDGNSFAGVGTPACDRPSIVINLRQADEILADSWRAVHAANLRDPRAPFLMKRSSSLVRIIETDTGKIGGGKIPTIQPASEAVLFGYLFRNASWFRKNDEGQLIPNQPSKFLAADMLAFIPDAIPSLELVASTPVFTQDGVLVDEAGYHAQSAIYYSPAEGLYNLQPVSREPSTAQVEEAVSLLMEDLLYDFPFITAADRAHAIACMILPAARNMISGPTPMHLIEAPSAGSGKGLLTSCIGITATGKNPETRTLASEDAEARKMITAELEKARQMIILDNATEKHRIDCPPLASVLTSTVWSDRKLNETQMLDLPNRATWIFTGNNPRLSRELARRCIRIAIDPQTDQPWRRASGDFKHANLLDWALTNRSRLVHASLTIVSNWIARGRPHFTKARLGSFESWSAIVGGILEAAGIESFLGNLAEMYETADEESQEWRQFVTQWWSKFKAREVRISDLNELASKAGLLYGVRGEGSPHSQNVRLGKGVSRMRMRVFDGKRIKSKIDSRSKAQLVFLELMPGAVDDAETAPSYIDEQRSRYEPSREDLDDLADLADAADRASSQSNEDEDLTFD